MAGASEGRRLAGIAALALVSLGVAAAQPDPHPAHTRWEEGVLRVDASMVHFVTPERIDPLRSGLPQTLALEIEVVPAGGGARIAEARRTCEVIYDLWDRVFRVELTTGHESRGSTASTLEEVLDRCLTVRDLPIGAAEAYHHGEAIQLVLRAELNPLTPDTVHRIRRWLARPGGASEPADTFFGSFVGLFVNRSVAAAEAELEERSAPLEVP